jgi:hypothetical protein
MSNREKATHILTIIMEELNMPYGSTIGDVAHALSIIDPDDGVMKLLLPVLRDAVIDEIKHKIA